MTSPTSPTRPILATALLVAAAAGGQAQTSPDPELVKEIAGIKAIDTHTHPEQVLADGEMDTEWDGFSSDSYQAQLVPNVPANVRPHSHMIVASWRALWGIPDLEYSEEAMNKAMENKRRIVKEKGDSYPAWVLDQAGVEIALSNRITMQRGLRSGSLNCLDIRMSEVRFASRWPSAKNTLIGSNMCSKIELWKT